MTSAVHIPEDRDRFIRLLRVRFPAIEASIDECCRGLLHCEMGSFAHATQNAIDTGEVNDVRSHFEFADELLRDGGPELENAICVSYLECVDFDGSSAKAINARQLLTTRLQAALTELEAHMARIFGS